MPGVQQSFTYWFARRADGLIKCSLVFAAHLYRLYEQKKQDGTLARVRPALSGGAYSGGDGSHISIQSRIRPITGGARLRNEPHLIAAMQHKVPGSCFI